MKKIKKGDIVSRNSYQNDILFYVEKIVKTENRGKLAILKGVTIRIEADAPIEDLQIVNKQEQEKYEKELEERIINRSQREKTKKESRRKEVVCTGRILHLDGDKKYSEKSVNYYRKMGLNATVKNIPENKQPKVVYKLLQIYQPDILIITRT